MLNVFLLVFSGIYLSICIKVFLCLNEKMLPFCRQPLATALLMADSIGVVQSIRLQHLDVYMYTSRILSNTN